MYDPTCSGLGLQFHFELGLRPRTEQEGDFFFVSLLSCLAWYSCRRNKNFGENKIKCFGKHKGRSWGGRRAVSSGGLNLSENGIFCV